MIPIYKIQYIQNSIYKIDKAILNLFDMQTIFTDDSDTFKLIDELRIQLLKARKDFDNQIKELKK